MTSSALNADELGEKGQARFREICADAKLVCNPSGRDRMGWDFIVEFPFQPPGPHDSLDERATPLSCHVQVKTLLDTSDSVKLRLSSAEYLAKELKPAFIYVFKVNAALEFTRAHLIHLSDAALASILRRLRQEESTAKKGPNKKFLSLSVKKYAIELAPTGTQLRSAVQSACGNSMSEYIAKKLQELNTLGFAPRRYEVKASLIFDNTEHLVDAFLGLRRNIPATDLNHSITRFGIKKPLSFGATEGLVSILPRPVDTCTIAVRTDALSQPAVFPGKVLLPAIPDLPQEYRKVVFDAGLFQLHVSRRGGLSLTSDEQTSPLTPKVWSAYWRLALVIAQGAGTIEILADTKPFRYSFSPSSKSTSIDPKECAHWCKLCDRASAVLAAAGVLEEPEVSMVELQENSDGIHSAFALLNPHLPKRPARFITQSVDGVAIPDSLDVLYSDYLRLGSVAVGYYGVGKFLSTRIGEKIEWASETVSLKRIMRLKDFPAEYLQMIEAAKADGDYPAQCFRQPA